MNAVVEQISLPSLRPEWERIELLAYSLGQERQGKTLTEALLERLKQLQGEVERLREQNERLRGEVKTWLDCYQNAVENHKTLVRRITEALGTQP